MTRNDNTRTYRYWDADAEEFVTLIGEVRTTAGYTGGVRYRDAIKTDRDRVVEVTRYTDCGSLGTDVRELKGWPSWARSYSWEPRRGGRGA